MSSRPPFNAPPPRPTFVIGHRNPDVDSICSAIGYAAYQRARGDETYVPARCGNTNARIDAILRRFNVPAPIFVGDVTPRVRDIMVSEVISVGPDQTCAEALELIDQHDIRVLPVLGPQQRLLGSVSVFQLGDYFIPKPQQTRKLRHVFTSIASIVRALNAEILNVVDAERTQDFFVRVGAMDIRTFGKLASSEMSPDKSVIVVGDRWDIQQKSIQVGMRLMVISGNLPVDPEVLDMAREKGVSVIVSPFDTATTALVIRTAHRIDRVLEEQVVTFGPDEKLSVVRRKMAATYAPAYMVVDDAGALVGVFSKTDLLKPVPTRLVLVDHNEVSQAVAGAAEVNIIEIIDHHRLGNPPTQQPILFVNRPVGSTCTIIADLFRRDGLQPTAEIAGILLAGLVTDTLNLNSPTSTRVDEEVRDWLADLAGITPEALTELIFSSGSVIAMAAPEAVVRSDMKVYHEGSVRFSVSQVEEVGFGNFWEKSEALLTALNAVRGAEGLYFSALLVTDINTQNSLLLVQGAAEVVEQVTYPTHRDPHIFDLPGIVSRKKQLMPYLTSLLGALGITPTA